MMKLKTFYPHGFVKEGFEEVKEIFRENLATGLERGGSFAAYYKGELVVNLWGGLADPLCRREWKEDTVSCFFSTTKSISAVVIAHLVDRGLLKYEDKISQLWPEFSQNGKENITLEEFLSHKAGLAACEEGFDIKILKDNPRELGNILAKQKPLWNPGVGHGYHPITFSLYLDQIVRRVDCKFRNLAQYFEEEIADVFDLDIHIGLPKPLQYRCAKISVRESFNSSNNPESFNGDLRIQSLLLKQRWKHINMINDTDFMSIPCGSSHGFSTAAAMAKFYSILGNGGVLNGNRLLSGPLIKRLQKPLSWGVDKVYGSEDIFSYGTIVIPVIEDKKVIYQFGHSGYGGQIALADCEYQVGWAYVTNHLNIEAMLHIVNDSKSLLYQGLYRCIHRLENKEVHRRTFTSYHDLQKAVKSQL